MIVWKEVSYKKLWKLLIDKDMKKKDLAASANIGLSSMAKMGRGKHVSLDVLLKICTALNCDFGDKPDRRSDPIAEFENEEEVKVNKATQHHRIELPFPKSVPLFLPLCASVELIIINKAA